MVVRLVFIKINFHCVFVSHTLENLPKKNDWIVGFGGRSVPDLSNRFTDVKVDGVSSGLTYSALVIFLPLSVEKPAQMLYLFVCLYYQYPIGA